MAKYVHRPAGFFFCEEMLGVSPLQETYDDPWLGQEYERVDVADEQAAQDEVAQLATGGADLDLQKSEF